VQYLSRSSPYMISADDVYLTSGCAQAIKIIYSVLASHMVPTSSSKANCESPSMSWKRGTLISYLRKTGRLTLTEPCGNVYTYEHLPKVSATKGPFDRALK
jgi:tyrosine aminotransferase